MSAAVVRQEGPKTELEGLWRRRRRQDVGTTAAASASAAAIVVAAAVRGEAEEDARFCADSRGAASVSAVVPAVLPARVPSGVLRGTGTGTAEPADARGSAQAAGGQQTLFGVPGARAVQGGRARSDGQQARHQLSDGQPDADLQAGGAGGGEDHRRGG